MKNASIGTLTRRPRPLLGVLGSSCRTRESRSIDGGSRARRGRSGFELLAIVLLLGCQGAVGEPGDGPNGPDDDDNPFVTPHACRAGDTPDADLVRLSRSTYLSALDALVGPAALARIEPSLAGLPATRAGVYSSELPPPSFGEVAAYEDIAAALADELTKDGPSLASMSPCLERLPGTVDPHADACLGAFVEDFGRRLLRAPVSAEDRTRFLDAFSIGGADSAAEGVATLLMTMLLDPRFLYFVEVDGAEVRPGVLELTDHELAARLARVLWDSIPDDALVAAADAGFDAVTLRGEVERMWGDPRTRGAMRRFYREWLELESLPASMGEFAPDAPSADALRSAMRLDLLAFTEALTFDRAGSYRDLLLDRTAFVFTSDLAAVYGLPGPAAGEVTLGLERRGILTRPGWLATSSVAGSNAGHIIKRGARMGRFLCAELPPPDPNAFPADDPASPIGATVAIRERFQAVTSELQCAACHTRLDAYGAPFGGFGSTGEEIDAERVTEPDGSTRTLAIDTMSRVPLDGSESPVSNAAELSEVLAESEQAAACFATHVTRNFVGRALRESDACLVKRARDVLQRPDSDPGSIREAILELLLSTEFTTRTVPR